VLVLALCVPDLATADAAPTAQLTYIDATGLPACPGEAVLRRGVSARLGRSPFVDASSQRVVVTLSKGDASKGGAGLIGKVASFDGDVLLGEREVVTDTQDCRGLTEALELPVALAIDPVAAMSTPAVIEEPVRRVVAVTPKPEPEPRPEPAREPVRIRERPVIQERVVPAEPVPSASARPATSPPPSPFGFQLSAALDLDAFSTPGLTPGVSLEAGVRTWQWSVSLEGRHVFRGAGPMTQGEVGLGHTTASLVGCGLLGWIDLCALAGGGVAAADGRGLDTNATGTVTQAHVGGRAGIRFALTPDWFARLDGSLRLPLFPVTLQVSGVPVWTAGALDLGVGFRVGRVLW